VLKISTAPVTWPIGMGRAFKGIYHLLEDRIYVYEAGRARPRRRERRDRGPAQRASRAARRAGRRLRAGDRAGAGRRPRPSTSRPIRAGKQTPVFFGSAIGNFGVEELLTRSSMHAPPPLPRATRQRTVESRRAEAHRLRVQDPGEHGPAHRDRIAFLRLCSGKYTRGMR
jgi:peptide chain release factor 3